MNNSYVWSIRNNTAIRRSWPFKSHRNYKNESLQKWVVWYRLPCHPRPSTYHFMEPTGWYIELLTFQSHHIEYKLKTGRQTCHRISLKTQTIISASKSCALLIRKQSVKMAHEKHDSLFIRRILSTELRRYLLPVRGVGMLVACMWQI